MNNLTLQSQLDKPYSYSATFESGVWKAGRKKEVLIESDPRKASLTDSLIDHILRDVQA